MADNYRNTVDISVEIVGSGPAGRDGTDGSDGYSPEVTIAEITGGHRVTITDRDHPSGQSFDVLDGQGGSGGTTDHRQLSNRDADNQHPMSAITGLSSALAGKQGTISDLDDIRAGAALGETAVQPESGKGLSTNDYTTTEKNKLAGISPGAEVNVQADWTQTDASADDYIKNKPTIPTALSQLTADATHRTVTDTEKETWNGKSDFSGSYDDLTDKPTIPDELSDLTQDATHRTVTDTEKATWNGKGTYSKPSGGIPKTDLAADVQTSLGLADSALQSVPATYRTAAAQDVIDAGKVDKSAQSAKTSAMTQAVGIDNDGKLWTTPGGGGGASTAEEVSYDNTASGYHATDVQNAVDESAVIAKGQQRQITALHNLLEGVTYSTETDTTAAYAKTVPSGAQAVSVNSFGGHCEVVDDEIVSAGVTEIESTKADDTPLGSITLPSALLTFLADKGYGWSAGTAYNEIDFANKKYIQRVGKVDAGTLNWFFEPYASANVFMLPYNELDVVNPYPSSTWVNLLCEKYETKPSSGSFGAYKDINNVIYLNISTDKRAPCVRDDSFDGDADDFKVALSGVDIYYELAEPVEYDISSYLPTDEAFNFLLTEPGGALTFKQSDNTELSVPQNLTWAMQISPNTHADDVSYDNTTSGLTAEDVQGAIDELSSEKVNVAAQAAKSEAMTQPVGIDGNGKLWTTPGGGGGGDTAGVVAPAYDAESTYAADDLVIHDALLYRCLEDIEIPEDWTQTHWEQTTVDAEMAKYMKYSTLVVTCLTQDGVTVTGQTVTVRKTDASGDVYATAAYNGQPVSILIPVGFNYHVSVSDTLDHHFNPTTATGFVNVPTINVTLMYSDFSNIKTFRDVKAALNVDIDLTELVGEQVEATRQNKSLAFDVVDYDAQDNSVWLLLHDTMPNQMVFEPEQALAWFENGLAAGDYCFTHSSSVRFFTLTKPIPEGGQLKATGSAFSTYASQDASTAIESGSVTSTEIAGATSLGTTAEGDLNHMDRVQNGSNNAGESGLFAWLNSDAGPNENLPRVNKFSRPYSSGSDGGFLNGFDAESLACLEDVTWQIQANNIYEAPAALGGIAVKGQTYSFHGKIGLAKLANIGLSDNNPWDLYVGATNTDRIKYYNGGTRGWWAFDVIEYYSNRERVVSTSGELDFDPVIRSYGVVPACKIKKSII